MKKTLRLNIISSGNRLPEVVAFIKGADDILQTKLTLPKGHVFVWQIEDCPESSARPVGLGMILVQVSIIQEDGNRILSSADSNIVTHDPRQPARPVYCDCSSDWNGPEPMAQHFFDCLSPVVS